MSTDSTFEGTLTIRSASFGFAVTFQGQTDAHDLGHAFAAAMVHYIDRVKKSLPHADTDELCEIVIAGIHCGLKHNPEPLIKH